jgi:hypothetical protein
MPMLAMMTRVSGGACRVVITVFLISLLAGRLGAAEGEPPKLAILAESPEAKTPADVLTVQWSLAGNVTLLERSALDKVLSEQSLAAGNQKNYVKLAQLLGADGLVILDVVKTGTNSLLATRLVAASPGVVLDLKGFPLPLKDVEAWSEFMVKSHTPLLPKLKVARTAAVPLSILNLRASLDSATNRQLEHQLTVLTGHRLVQQRDLFVLERQRLEDLTWEKELAGVDETPFWTGSFLLEGVLDKEGIDPQTLTISARLVSPKGGPAMPLEVSGARNNIPAVADQLAKKLSELILNKTDWPAWDIASEAEKYHQEADWARLWQLQDQAQQSIEAAWALGRRNAQTALLRVEIYREGALTQARRQWYENIHFIAGYYSVRPTRSHLASALKALNIYRENVQQQAALPGLSADQLSEQGLAVLEAGSMLLEQFRYHVRAQRGNESGVADLQTFCREQCQLVETVLTGPGVTSQQLETWRSKLYHLQFRFSYYWFPEVVSAARYYSQLLESERYPICRQRMLTDPEFRFRFWRYEDQRAGRKAWVDMVDALCRADDFRLRCEGELLRLRDLPTGESSDGSRRISGTDNPVTDELQASLRRQVDLVVRLLWDERTEAYATKFGVDMIDAFEELVTRKCSGWDMPVKEVLIKEQNARKLGRFAHYLQRATRHETARFSALGFDFTPLPKQARALLPHILEYKVRFKDGDWIAHLSKIIENQAALSFEELKQWLPGAAEADAPFLPYLVGGKVYAENESLELRPLLVAYQQRVPAAAEAVDRILNTQVPTHASREEARKREHERIYHKMKTALETGSTFDPELEQAINKVQFSEAESRFLLPLLQANRPNSKAHPVQLGIFETKLRHAVYTTEYLKDHLRAVPKVDEELLKFFFTGPRLLNAQDAAEIKPLWDNYKRRMPDNPQLQRLIDFKIDAALRKNSQP